ncbi:unnamed protein product [Prorocentrum cordatum]|uniref:Cellulase n=1 Tax=Prorocentrum cordatum TaxID=2364126 RepID=A0ABN9UDU8_9DINO|nr:unnamed protein product [Polarella glacialis]
MAALAAADLVPDAEAPHSSEDLRALLRPDAPARQRRSAWRLAAGGAVAALLVLGAAAAPAASAVGRSAQGCASGSCGSRSRSLDATLLLKSRGPEAVSVPPEPARGDDDDTRVLDVGRETTTAVAGEETTTAAGEETTAALAGDDDDEAEATPDGAEKRLAGELCGWWGWRDNGTYAFRGECAPGLLCMQGPEAGAPFTCGAVGDNATAHV